MCFPVCFFRGALEQESGAYENSREHSIFLQKKMRSGCSKRDTGSILAALAHNYLKAIILDIP